MSEWNALTYEGKDNILRVVRREANEMFALAEQPGAWEAPTACESWKVKDVVGHIVDTTEGYFRSFDIATSGSEAPDPRGLLVMHEMAGASAQRFGDLSQQEMIARARTDLDKMMGLLQAMTEEQWGGGFLAPHAYMGPVPPSIYAGGQLMDYGVHTWDIRQGSGRAHALPADTADLLVPYMFIIWQYTIRPDADLSPFQIGIRVSGRNAGDTRVSISDQGMSYEPGNIDDLPAILEFDPGSMVLTAFGRVNGGTAIGDASLADRFLNLFYRI